MNKNELIETYYRENYKELLKIARRRIGDYDIHLAEEAVQESFYRALKFFRTYKADQDFNNWFNRILINTINVIKWKERDAGACGDDEQQDSVGYNGNVVFSKEIIDLLNRQNERNLTILNMYFFEEFKSREISEFTNISHDVVRDVIRTFRKRARDV